MIFTYDNLWVKRPGNGKILSKDFKKVIGKRASKDIDADKQLTPSDVKG